MSKNPFAPVGSHNPLDADQSEQSLHHTLGPRNTQAAPGDHGHLGSISVIIGGVAPSKYLPLNGATIARTDYPAFFALYNIATDTVVLPTVASLAVRVLP